MRLYGIVVSKFPVLSLDSISQCCSKKILILVLTVSPFVRLSLAFSLGFGFSLVRFADFAADGSFESSSRTGTGSATYTVSCARKTM